MRRAALGVLFATLIGLAGTGCGDPCEKLAEKICAHVEDARACERSRRDMESFTAEVCSSALPIFEEKYAGK